MLVFKITIQNITWLNGFSALMLVIVAFIYAIYYVNYYRRSNNKFYISGAVLGFAVALGWSGITLSFLSVVIYGYNLPGLKLYVNILSYSTIPIGSIAVLSIAWDLLLPPKHKNKVLILVGILSIFYYIILFATFDKAVISPDVHKGEIYDDWLSSQELPYYLVWGLVLGNTVIFAWGIIRFLKATTGDLRKRAIWIIIATPIFGLCITLDTVVFTDVSYVDFLFIPRLLMIPALILVYLGFKPSKE